MYKNVTTIINSCVPYSNNYGYFVDVLAAMCCRLAFFLADRLFELHIFWGWKIHRTLPLLITQMQNALLHMQE